MAVASFAVTGCPRGTALPSRPVQETLRSQAHVVPLSLTAPVQSNLDTLRRNHGHLVRC